MSIADPKDVGNELVRILGLEGQGVTEIHISAKIGTKGIEPSYSSIQVTKMVTDADLERLRKINTDQISKPEIVEKKV